MFSLIVILLVVFVVLALLLAAWTLFFQGYIYNEPAEAIYWRAPAAAAALTAFLALWVVCDYRSIDDATESEGHYQPLQNFSYRETKSFKYLWITTQNRKDDLFELRGNQYRNKSNQGVPTRPFQIVASDELKGEKHVFKPQFDPQGRFITDKDSKTVRYYEDGDPKKRSMTEDAIGSLTSSHPGWLVGAVFLHLGLLAVWFVSLWLLLRFQWTHALGLACAFWLVNLFILPMILTPAEKLRKERLPPPQAPAIACTSGRPNFLPASGREG